MGKRMPRQSRNYYLQQSRRHYAEAAVYRSLGMNRAARREAALGSYFYNLARGGRA